MPARPGSRIRSAAGVWRDERGQVVWLGAVVVVALLAFLLVIPNATGVTTRRMRGQCAADAGAFTGSLWLARALNLNASMNCGIRSIYTWMTVLTAAEALSQALYSDSADPSVRALGRDMCLALFGSPDPVYTSTHGYREAIAKLAETAQWLYALQTDVAASFPEVAQALGAGEACRTVSCGDPSSRNPGGRVLAGADDTLPLLVTDPLGDSLMLAELRRIAAALDTMPTCDSCVGPARGIITVDSLSYGTRAWYGDSSNWCTLVQVLAYQKYIMQYYLNPGTGVRDSGAHFFRKPGGALYTRFLQGDTWVKYWYPHPGPWYWDGKVIGSDRYKVDTMITRERFIKVNDPRWDSVRTLWTYSLPSTGPVLPEVLPWVNDSGDVVYESYFVRTGFYTGAESTNGLQGAKLRLRRPNPGRSLHTVSFVWWHQGSSTPFGPGAALAGSLFPRSRVAAPCPMLCVARAEPYLARDNPTDDDYYFAPDWDVRLVPLDSAGVAAIRADTAYGSHNLTDLDLEGLRRHVTLP